MTALEEELSRQFHAWELRGRGWKCHPHPVPLEPPFVPFSGYTSPQPKPRDDGKRHTFLSGLIDRFIGNKSALPEPEEPEPEPETRIPQELSEIQLTLPISKPLPSAAIESLLQQMCRPGEPFAFELLGTAKEIVPQFAIPFHLAGRADRALGAYLSNVSTLPADAALVEAWSNTSEHFAVVELGLAEEFFLPLNEPRSDLLASVVNALDGLAEGECGLYQVLFEFTEKPWAQSIPFTVIGRDRKPIFANRPELVGGAAEKANSPLLAVVIRLAACASSAARCWEIISDLARPFATLARPNGNHLLPLANDAYPPADHEADVLARLSRRSGMLLSLSEFAPLVTPPTSAVSRRLRRDTARTRVAPQELKVPGSLLLGTNQHAGRAEEVWLSPSHRVRHVHLIGASGTGKSTLLFNLLQQDIERGEGVALLDPHGDLVEKVLGIIPPHRVKDVVLVDPSDEEHSVGFNILAAHSDFERNLLASDLVSIFRRLSTSWGDQMNSVLRNAILAFLESSEGGTLADLRRFLLDPAYRARFLHTVTDPEVVYYWKQAFPQLTGNKSIGPVMTRLDEFLSRKPIRYMVAQKENRLDFSDILDHGKILLIKLPQGQIGRENAFLLGSIFVSKIQQTAMSRQRMKESERRDFWCYIDEFQNFITPSMAEILTGARKYRVGLVLAHQSLNQLTADRDVSDAVLANCCTRIAFRVSDADARALDSGFAHFEARDIQSLSVGNAICCVERSDCDFNLRIPEPSADDDPAIREAAIAHSRALYSKPRAEIEAELLRKAEMEEQGAKSKAAPSKKERVPEKEPPPASEAPKEAPVPPAVPLAVAPKAAPVAEPPRPVGQGRGGEDHQLIVANLASEASRRGFRSVKECVVTGGRIDLVIETTRRRIAIEVAVNSNTAHEIENLRKCADSNPDFIVSVSPHPNVCASIAKAAERSFDPAMLAKMRFESPESLVKWLQEIEEAEKDIIPPGVPKPRVIAGRKVKTRHIEMSPDERRKKETEEIEVIADLLRNRSTKNEAAFE